MDISKLRPVKISPYAEERIIKDFFPESVDQDFLSDEELMTREMNIHAGALCLYVATLMTKIYDTNVSNIEFEASEREKGLREAIKAHHKFCHMSDEDIDKMARNFILKEIRNGFAHGNFEISYDIYTKKLYYVLKPKRKDFIVDKPIVISKETLLKANYKHVENVGKKFHLYPYINVENEVKYNLSENLKKFILPIDMIRLSEHYLTNKRNIREKLNLKNKKYSLIHYALLAGKITYEQDDYYNIFGKDSNMFARIAHIRNSVAHDSYSFVKCVESVNYLDREKSLNETVQNSVVSLRIANDLKNLILQAKRDGVSEEDISKLTEKLKMFFDMMFLGIEHSIEDFLENE